MGAIQPPPRKLAGLNFPSGLTPALQDEPMHFEPGIPRLVLRTVWISDTHLGTPGCKAEASNSLVQDSGDLVPGDATDARVTPLEPSLRRAPGTD